MTPTDNIIQQWEYHRLYLSSDDNIMDKLYGVGSRGWQLVSIVPENKVDGYLWFYFKRPLNNQQTNEHKYD